MEYKLLNGVWELTMECNMRCKHCGSSCAVEQEDELTTLEALNLCDELKELGMEYITLSGGEPTLRKDLPAIIRKLTDNGIMVSIITNAWIVDDMIVNQAKDAGVKAIAISIDGLLPTHDKIRRSGSYNRSIAALKLIKKYEIIPAVITTVNSVNITELDKMHDTFSEIGVAVWQMQLALPMGNLKHNTEYFLEPFHVNQLIDFAHSKIAGTIDIALADSVGYYNKKIVEIHEKSNPGFGLWSGCTAGRCTIGIFYNGDITGCASLRDREFVEGNIRERSLRDIWYSENSFAWNRQMKKNLLKGFCAKCQYNNCLGGCSNSRLCMNGNIYSDNKYCSYHFEMSKVASKVANINDPMVLLNNAYFLANEKQFQFAEIFLSKFLSQEPDNTEAKELLGYIHYELGNYELCEKINTEILAADPENAYASKGLGLAECKTGHVEDGVSHMYKATNMVKGVNCEIFYDLFITLLSLQRNNEAQEVKIRAEGCSDYSDWDERFCKALSSKRLSATK